jgi:hypothetical protein
MATGKWQMANGKWQMAKWQNGKMAYEIQINVSISHSLTLSIVQSITHAKQ